MGTANELSVFDGWGADSCYSRALGPLGQGIAGPTTIPSSATEGNAWLSADPTINPRFYNWNVAYAHYCDGGSFAG